MNNNTLANIYRPKSFKDFISHDNGDIDLIKHLISKNLHSNLNNNFSITVLLIEGPPGSGKSSLSKLYAKATLCPNRPKEEYEPCGDCDICNDKDTSNIYEYTIKSSTEAREVVQKLVEQSYCSPIRTTGREDQYRQFIILDELENASAELISSYLLKPLEDNPNTTTWILSTMDLEKLERRNPIVKEAITSRATVISLYKFTEEQIANILEERANIQIESGLLIAKVANGNLREAWSIVSKIAIISGLNPSEFKTEVVGNYLFGGITYSVRLSLWEALKNDDATLVKSIFKKWSTKISQKIIADLLVEDLISFINTPNKNSQELLFSLTTWYNSTIKYDLSLVFLQYLGIDFIENKVVKLKPLAVNNVSNINNNLLALAEKKGKVNNLNKESIMPFYLTSDSISDILKRYN